ncbi:hypothetical protein [Prosthecochloris sp. HL-130-GSB]|uniref:hypothetical protein n=1 Tax=Prosthecochloris sp. HL-130-GSB TaxID=1974213 RepID=UPI0012F4D4C0|nr:hypothetical protein [Prosthecochloris sp. HL-130-GSB]
MGSKKKSKVKRQKSKSALPSPASSAQRNPVTSDQKNQKSPLKNQKSQSVKISGICGQQKKSQKLKGKSQKKTTSANPHTLQIKKVNQ